MAGFRFPYRALPGVPDSSMARLQVELVRGTVSIYVDGLIDTGSASNILPYSIGRALGGTWNRLQPAPIFGAFGSRDGRAMLVSLKHPQLTPDAGVELACVWLDTDNVPILFGQVNFLEEFRVCFDARNATFEVFPNASLPD